MTTPLAALAAPEGLAGLLRNGRARAGCLFSGRAPLAQEG
jgi:hypothetical protein